MGLGLVLVLELVIRVRFSEFSHNPLCYDSSSFSSEQIHNQQEWWQWLNKTVIPGLYPDVWYNGNDSYPVGYLGDTPTAWLLGVARLRQLRIQKSKDEMWVGRVGAIIFWLRAKRRSDSIKRYKAFNFKFKFKF